MMRSDMSGSHYGGHGQQAKDMLPTWAMIGGGAMLLMLGMRRQGWLGAGMALAGGALVGRALRDQGGTEGLMRSVGMMPTHHQRFEHSITINRPRGELYSFWRDFSNLPRIMPHLIRVDVKDDRRSHWVARSPTGGTVEWDAVVTDERQDERLAWRSVEGADIDNSGQVEFREAPGGRGTELRVVLEYESPGGRIGQVVAKMLGEEPEMQVRHALRTFKQIMETGSPATVEGQPSGGQVGGMV